MDKSNNSSRVKFTIDKTGFFAEGAMILLVFAALFQVIGRWGQWNNRIDAIMLIALPAVSCLLLALCVLLFGKRGFFLSSLPVLMGVVFFIFKLLNSTSWVHTVLCILLYLAIVIVYPATVFGWIRTKWLLPPLFGVPFAIHIARDFAKLTAMPDAITFSAGMQEMSMLCMMAALMFIGFGLKKHEPEPTVVEPEVVEPASKPDPAPAEKPAPVEKPAPAVEPAPAEKPAPAVAPAPVEKPAPAEAPAPAEESVPEFSFEAAFEPAPEGSIPDLTLDPDPVDFRSEADAQDSAHEQ